MTLRTVTLNTGFDEIVTIRDIVFGGVADIVKSSTHPSGKGINAARVAHALGLDVSAYGLVGRGEHEHFAALLQRAGVRPRLVAVDAGTRRNLTIMPIESSRPAAHLKADGFRLTDDVPVRQLLDMLRAEIEAGDIVSLHGSVPYGIDPAIWVEFAGAIRAARATVVVDVHGPALRRVIEGSPIRACKPNESEIDALVERNGVSASRRVADALQAMKDGGVALPIVSMEGAGVAFVEGGVIRRMWREATSVRILVGAGDAFMAGLLVGLASGVGDIAALRTATACGSLHVEGWEPKQIAARVEQAMGEVRIDTSFP